MVVLALIGVVPAVPALAANTGGTVAAWGYNISGQATVPAGLSGVTAVAAGGYHSLASMSDGTVVAWGLQSSGEQLTVPPGLSGVTAIAAGYDQGLEQQWNGQWR